MPKDDFGRSFDLRALSAKLFKTGGLLFMFKFICVWMHDLSYSVLANVFRRPCRFPKLYINRRAAAEHRDDPAQDPEAKNSMFMQIYEGLKPRDNTEKPLDYRLGHLYCFLFLILQYT